MMDLETAVNQSCSYKENSAFHSHYLSLLHSMLHPANIESMEHLLKLTNRKNPKSDYYEETATHLLHHTSTNPGNLCHEQADGRCFQTGL